MLHITVIFFLSLAVYHYCYSFDCDSGYGSWFVDFLETTGNTFTGIISHTIFMSLKRRINDLFDCMLKNFSNYNELTH